MQTVLGASGTASISQWLVGIHLCPGLALSPGAPSKVFVDYVHIKIVILPECEQVNRAFLVSVHNTCNNYLQQQQQQQQR